MERRETFEMREVVGETVIGESRQKSDHLQQTGIIIPGSEIEVQCSEKTDENSEKGQEHQEVAKQDEEDGDRDEKDEGRRGLCSRIRALNHPIFLAKIDFAT